MTEEFEIDDDLHPIDPPIDPGTWVSATRIQLSPERQLDLELASAPVDPVRLF